VLFVALISDGYSWLTAYRQLRATRKEASLLRAAQASKDPSTFAVLFEDSAAGLGVVVAFVGVLLSQVLDSPYPDGVASLVIGSIMAGTAVLLMYESKKLLIGESADHDMIAGIREIADADAAVAHCGPPLTMHLGPDDILLNLDIQFEKDLPAEEIIDAVDRLEHGIRARYKVIRRIFIEAERFRLNDGRPTESPRTVAGYTEDGARSCPAERTPADY
jgi:divalent metal cation (Fe/Co/Zn/Cd) transporter